KSTLEITEPLDVSGDPERLQQVVWNLLSNAIKFSARGGCVWINLRPDESEVELEVKDNGRGIHSDFLPFIFDRFRQAESGSRRVHGGLGFGLSISRELIELHNGSICAKSPGEGTGATFTVRLPLRPRQGAGLTRTDRPSKVSLAGIKVLLGDDDADELEVAMELLNKNGAYAIGASSARDALAAIKSSKPDVLISDIGMPYEDGYDLIRKVRALDPEEGG